MQFCTNFFFSIRFHISSVANKNGPAAADTCLIAPSLITKQTSVSKRELAPGALRFRSSPYREYGRPKGRTHDNSALPAPHLYLGLPRPRTLIFTATYRNNASETNMADA